MMSQPTHAAESVVDTKEGSIKVETVADGLEHPWGWHCFLMGACS